MLAYTVKELLKEHFNRLEKAKRASPTRHEACVDGNKRKGGGNIKERLRFLNGSSLVWHNGSNPF